MRMWQSISALVVLVGPAVVLLYDFAVLRFVGKAATITHVVQQWALEHEEMPAFVAGLFVWLWLHLFLKVILGQVVKGAGAAVE